MKKNKKTWNIVCLLLIMALLHVSTISVCATGEYTERYFSYTDKGSYVLDTQSVTYVTEATDKQDNEQTKKQENSINKDDITELKIQHKNAVQTQVFVIILLGAIIIVSLFVLIKYVIIPARKRRIKDER